MGLKWQKIAFKLLKRCTKFAARTVSFYLRPAREKPIFGRKRRIWRFWALFTIFARSGVNLSLVFLVLAAQRKFFFRKKQNKRNLPPWNSKKRLIFFEKKSWKKRSNFFRIFFLIMGRRWQGQGSRGRVRRVLSLQIHFVGFQKS